MCLFYEFYLHIIVWFCCNKVKM